MTCIESLKTYRNRLKIECIVLNLPKNVCLIYLMAVLDCLGQFTLKEYNQLTITFTK